MFLRQWLVDQGLSRSFWKIQRSLGAYVDISSYNNENYDQFFKIPVKNTYTWI
jgi:hypothetical protein